MAKKLNLPVLLPVFIADCWSRSHLGNVDLRQMGVLHAVPVFYGCVISVTGISIEERQKMSRLISTHGGVFSADLHANCTHLIVAPDAAALSRRASPKLAYARKWEIPLATPDWLYESLSKRTCLDHNQFKTLSLTASPSSTAGYTQNFLYDDLTAEEVSSVPLPPYLEGLHIYIGDQQPPERLALLKKLVLSAGGTRYSDFYDRSLITHYVVHNQTLTGNDIGQLRLFGDRPPVVVHDQWLFACFYAKQQAAIEPFTVCTATSILNPPKPSQDETPPTAPSATKNTVWSLRSQSTTLDNSLASENNFHLPVFAGVTFKLSFTDEPIKVAQVTDLIEKNGGIIAEAGDYTVGPMLSNKKSISPSLNEIWLETCINQACIVDPTTLYFYQTMLVDNPPSMHFCEFRVSITGYSGLERDFYARLITALGASYTENLSKKNNILLAASDSGPKYEFAKSAAIPIVSAQWLVESAKLGRPMDFDIFTLGAFDSEVKENFENLPLTPSAAVKRTSLEIETPLRNEITKKLKQVASTVSPTGLTQDGDPLKKSSSSTTSATADISKSMSGYIFAISQRLWHRREEMHDLVVELGGVFVWSYDTSCTHYIHQGNMLEETFSEFKIVRQAGKWIVSPLWLIKSKEAGRKLAEIDFPHTFNPNAPPPPLLAPLTSVHSQVSSERPLSPKIDFDAIIAADRKPHRQVISYSLSPMPARAVRSLSTVEVPKIFSFSALTPGQRATFPSTLSNLTSATTVIKNSSGWETDITHLIIGVLSKSEKFLCACAAGAWILRPEFVEACEREGKLVDEKKYEWQLGWSEDDGGNLARAPRYWRELCTRMGTKAFDGWNVLLVADQKRSPSLKSILLAGNGKVNLLGDLPPGDSDLGITHALVSSAQMKA